MPDRVPHGPLIDDVLRRIRLAGAFFLRTEMREPWAYVSLPTEVSASFVKPGARRLILFHLIAEGNCAIEVDGGPRVDLVGGDVVVLPYGHQHTAGSPGGTPPVPIGDILPPLPWVSLPVVRHGGEGACTQMVCGYLMSDDPLFHPLLQALPAVFRVHLEGPAMQWFEASVSYALQASGPGVKSPATEARLAELLFTEVLHQYVRERDAAAFGALGDDVIVRALTLLHGDPAHAWTLPELARRAGASRSILDERFRRLLGRSPMRYLTEWRMELAADLLRTTRSPVAQIASSAGYASEAAFNRAFKRHTGEPPARWRDRAA